MTGDPVIVRLYWATGLAVLGAVAWIGTAAGIGRQPPAPVHNRQPPAPLAALPELADTDGVRQAAALAANTRPAFAPDRLPAPYLMAPLAAASASGSSARLTGTVITPTVRMATISLGQGPSLRLRQGGDAIDGWRLLEVSSATATVQGPGGTELLTLDGAPVEEGAGRDAAQAAVRTSAPGTQTEEVAAPARSYPLQGVAGRGLPVGSDAAAVSEQVLATRQRIENERRRLREQRQRSGNEP